MSGFDDFIEGDDGDPFDPSATDAKTARLNETQDEARERALALLRERQRCYGAVFVSGGAGPAEVDFVLQDLMRFCRGATTTFHADPRIHALLEGRREVLLRIIDFARLSQDALYLKYHVGGS